MRILRKLSHKLFILKMRLTTPPDIRALQRQLKEARENHRPTKAVMRKIYLANPLHRNMKDDIYKKKLRLEYYKMMLECINKKKLFDNSR